MRVRVSFTVPPRSSAGLTQALVQGTELDVDTFTIEEGALLLFGRDGGPPIIAYAPGVWRTCSNIEALSQAQVRPLTNAEPQAHEDSERHQEAR